MKLNKKNAVIAIVLVAAIALMGFGFAAWTATLTAKGSIKGLTSEIKWDVEWVSCTLTDKSKNVVAPASVTPSGDQNAVIDFGTDAIWLDMPGAYAEYELVVINKGTVDADFISLECAPKSETNANIGDIIKTDVVSTLCDPLTKDGTTCKFNLVIYIDPTIGDSSSDPSSIVIPDDVTFELTLKYEQNVDSSDASIPTPSHLA